MLWPQVSFKILSWQLGIAWYVIVRILFVLVIICFNLGCWFRFTVNNFVTTVSAILTKIRIKNIQRHDRVGNTPKFKIPQKRQKYPKRDRKRVLHKCFSVNFTKLIRTLLFYYTYEDCFCCFPEDFV